MSASYCTSEFSDRGQFSEERCFVHFTKTNHLNGSVYNRFLFFMRHFNDKHWREQMCIVVLLHLHELFIPPCGKCVQRCSSWFRHLNLVRILPYYQTDQSDEGIQRFIDLTRNKQTVIEFKFKKGSKTNNNNSSSHRVCRWKYLKNLFKWIQIFYQTIKTRQRCLSTHLWVHASGLTNVQMNIIL